MQEKVDLFSRAHGLLNPIEWNEPFGMVVIEAMAAGCPVISFAQGALPEIVSHGKSGFLVDNIHQMIHCIGDLKALDRKAVRAHIEHNFSVRVMAENYTRVYHQVIASSSTKALKKRASPQIRAKRGRTAPTDAPTPIALPISSPFAPSQKSSRSKSSPMPSPFVRSKPPTEPDIEALP
jgi:hypothetical protein